MFVLFFIGQLLPQKLPIHVELYQCCCLEHLVIDKKIDKKSQPQMIDITRPLLIFGIYMENCKLSELAMPNMQVLKFYLYSGRFGNFLTNIVPIRLKVNDILFLK